MKQFIGYIRVSTKGQGESGLGLEAQQAAVEAHRQREGGTILKVYKEVESGKSSDRPELAKALLHARRAGATLLVAKLDRLSRNVAFLSALMEAGTPFVCCDMPTANELTIHVLVAVAQAEAKAISERTKAALAALKARGVKLGSARPGHWEGREERRQEGIHKARERSIERRKAKAAKLHKELCPIVIAYRTEGLTLAAIAARLNGEGWLTPRKKQWNEVYVHRFLKQCEQAVAGQKVQ